MMKNIYLLLFAAGLLAGCSKDSLNDRPADERTVMVTLPPLEVVGAVDAGTLQNMPAMASAAESASPTTAPAANASRAAGRETPGLRIDIQNDYHPFAEGRSMPQTRAEHPAFTNVWVLQFAADGTTLKCTNVGTVAAGAAVTAEMSVAEGCTVCIVANGPASGLNPTDFLNFQNFVAPMTFTTPDELAASVPYTGLLSEVSVVEHDGEAHIVAADGRPLTVWLTPCAATLTAVVDWRVEGWSVSSLELYRVPLKVRYILDMNFFIGYPITSEDGSFAYCDRGFFDSGWAAATSTSTTLTGSVTTGTWTLGDHITIENMLADPSKPRDHDNAPELATFVRVRATDNLTGSSVLFDVYPGNGAHDNYDLLRNHAYITRIGISGTADDLAYYASTDDRVQLTPVRANSAMVVPGKMVSFDVADRVKKANTATQDLNLSWALGTDYTPLLIWEDVQELIPASELKYDKTKGVLTVTTNALAGEYGGNAVVGLFPSGTADPNAGTCIWSWHVWVTDYQPDGTVDYGLEANQKAVVNGGQVHTYGSQFMDKNPGKVIMDRNLGATKAYDTIPEENDLTAQQAFGMFYQWGRKDPFPRATSTTLESTAPTTIPIYNGTTVLTEDGTGYKKVAIAAAGGAGPNIPYAVKNPLSFIYNTNVPKDWYTSTNSNSSQNNTLWGDGTNKSVYDPCPEGWRIAPNGTWSDFGKDAYASLFSFYINAEKEMASGPPAFKNYLNNGRYYEPSSGTVRAWYPATGYRDPANGVLKNVGYHGFSWSSSVNGTNGQVLHFRTGAIYPTGSDNRGHAYPVRCIQE